MTDQNDMIDVPRHPRADDFGVYTLFSDTTGTVCGPSDGDEIKRYLSPRKTT